jgi:hypothetical protein
MAPTIAPVALPAELCDVAEAATGDGDDDGVGVAVADGVIVGGTGIVGVGGTNKKKKKRKKKKEIKKERKERKERKEIKSVRIRNCWMNVRHTMKRTGTGANRKI